MITLTEDQRNAEEEFVSFMGDESRSVMVLAGYSGTGKSTLLKHLLSNYLKYYEINRLLVPELKYYEVTLTATTNKAAENLSGITGLYVSTIHSELGIRPVSDGKGGSKLNTNGARMLQQRLLVVDEASFIDRMLLKAIEQHTYNCKILYVGDPAQLIPVKASSSVVFEQGYDTVELKTITRQSAGNPIAVVGDAFRKTVLTGIWPQIRVDGKAIVHMNRDAFEDATFAAFHQGKNAKVLAWTNQTVQFFNQALNQVLQGHHTFKPGDYARVNEWWSGGKGKQFKADSIVQITDISDTETVCGVEGRYYTINECIVFCPDNLSDKKRAMKEALANNDYQTLGIIDSWIDLRHDFACTVNKSQGSTYDEVYIDLDDISRCNNGNTLARMLYVAITRARNKVVLTGDIA